MDKYKLRDVRSALVVAIRAIDAATGPPPDEDSVKRILDLMRAMPDRRDLYQSQSGLWFVTYSGDEREYKPLSTDEVSGLAEQGVIELLYPGCYKLAGTKRFDVKGREITPEVVAARNDRVAKP